MCWSTVFKYTCGHVGSPSTTINPCFSKHIGEPCTPEEKVPTYRSTHRPCKDCSSTLIDSFRGTELLFASINTQKLLQEVAGDVQRLSELTAMIKEEKKKQEQERAKGMSAADLDALIHESYRRIAAANPMQNFLQKPLPLRNSEGVVVSIPYKSGMTHEEFSQYAVNLDWEVNHKGDGEKGDDNSLFKADMDKELEELEKMLLGGKVIDKMMLGGKVTEEPEQAQE